VKGALPALNAGKAPFTAQAGPRLEISRVPPT
jgi:hypothetical protein